jgi:hypothetical protein
MLLHFTKILLHFRNICFVTLHMSMTIASILSHFTNNFFTHATIFMKIRRATGAIPKTREDKNDGETGALDFKQLQRHLER